MQRVANRTDKIRHIQARTLGLAAGCMLGLIGCQANESRRAPSLIGYWHPVEIDGESTTGSLVRLDLEDVQPDTLTVTGYRLSIECRDQGLFDKSRGKLISADQDLSKPPQSSCNDRDPSRLDALRAMTHQGVSIRLDPETLTAVLTTSSGRTARFDYIDMTPVD